MIKHKLLYIHTIDTIINNKINNIKEFFVFIIYIIGVTYH
jgi:hypothetical protein